MAPEAILCVETRRAIEVDLEALEVLAEVRPRLGDRPAFGLGSILGNAVAVERLLGVRQRHQPSVHGWTIRYTIADGNGTWRGHFVWNFR